MAAFENPTKTWMIAASCYIPKENPSKPLGEDAHFIAEQVIGVADGVGGWAKRGVDAGKYARKLMTNAAAVVRGFGCLADDVSPKEILDDAYWKTVVAGSSTACIVSYDGDEGVLRAANLGDSGFMVVRGGASLYKSPVQQSGFNHPYQLAWMGANVPEDAEELTVEAVEEGDVVIVGSDGLFDNLFEEDIVTVVETCLEKRSSTGEMAETLAETALEMSLDKGSSGPFEVVARKAGVKHSGGKYDDITVVVAYIV